MVLFGSVAFALELLDINHETLGEKKIREEALEHLGFLIVPGGYTQEYMPALTEGVQACSPIGYGHI